MQYKYEPADKDYSDLASGRVFYSVTGHPAFPIRLASEIFQRCMANRKAIYGVSGPCTLYDPCCGAAYHLSILGYLHGSHIREILASDIDKRAVELAARNLGLLTVAGVDQRISELTSLVEKHDKDSHRDALRSAHVIKNNILSASHEYSFTTKAFQADSTDLKGMLEYIPPASVDIVFTDVPYGQHSQWQSSEGSRNPLWSMLDALVGVLSSSGIAAIVSDKQQKVFHERYQRVEHFQIGKRRVAILRLI